MKKFQLEVFSKNHPLSVHQRLSFNLLLTASWISRRYHKLLKVHGISLPQYYLLRILYHEYPNSLSIKVLTQRMIDSNSNASRLMDKLCVKQLTERQINQEDRRQIDAKLTEKGYALIAELAPTVDVLFSQNSMLLQNQAEELCALLSLLRTHSES